VKRYFKDICLPDGMGDDEMTAIVDLSLDCPCVGDGGGVAATM